MKSFFEVAVVVVLGAVAFAVVTGRLAALKKLAKGGVPQYRPRPLLTPNEAEFYARLLAALPDANVFPQVALSAIIEPRSIGSKRLVDFRRISQKRVDFAVYTKELELVAIVELDDRTHSATRDKQRDALSASASVRTVRFESRKKPNSEQIRSAILEAKTRAFARVIPDSSLT
jgi:very-short-patch-repair endonuclease